MPTKFKTKSFGGCTFDRIIPSIDSLSSETEAFDIVVPFESALKLNPAIVRWLGGRRVLSNLKKSEALALTNQPSSLYQMNKKGVSQ